MNAVELFMWSLQTCPYRSVPALSIEEEIVCQGWRRTCVLEIANE
jgi:hypothetical protein